MEFEISESPLGFPPSSPPPPLISPPSSPVPVKTLDFEEPPLLEEDPDSLLTPSSPPQSLPYFPQPSSSFSSRVSFQSYFRPPIIGAGLSNLGNTCFMNSILQCFTHTVPLLQSLTTFEHPCPCPRLLQGFCAFCFLIEHIKICLLHPGGVYEPYRFLDNISNVSSLFQKYQQEDAHEFLQCLLDKLDSSCFNLDNQVSSSSSQKDSLVKQVFGGRLKSQLRCCNCGHCSDTFEPLVDLSLEIEDADTLPDALKSFTKVEKIEDSEMKFTCEKCEKEVVLEKQFTVDQAPSVAAFHLKRFKTDGYYVDKIDKYVQYPLELDLTQYTSNAESCDAELKYELYAVVVHIGSCSTSGHYFCYIRSAPQVWYRMDDSKVVSVSEGEVLNQEAYILFYAKQGTPCFSSFYEDLRQQNARSDMPITSPSSVLDPVCPMSTPSPEENNTTITEVETVEEKEKISIPSSEPSNIVENIEKNKDERQVPTPRPLRSLNIEIEKDNDIFVDEYLKTPSPRSPCREEQSGSTFIIPRDHLPMKGNNIRKRPGLNSATEEARKGAYRLTKSMSPLRAKRYQTFLRSPKSEGSLKKKNKSRLSHSYGSDGSTGISPLGSKRRRLVGLQ